MTAKLMCLVLTLGGVPVMTGCKTITSHQCELIRPQINELKFSRRDDQRTKRQIKRAVAAFYSACGK